jgi:hypothetical protein
METPESVFPRIEQSLMLFKPLEEEEDMEDSASSSSTK